MSGFRMSWRLSVSWLLWVRHLDTYTSRTGRLIAATVRVREALFTAVEPDELLFQSLPEALTLPEIPASAKEYSALGRVR